jgi:hypothetical protein
MTHPLSGEVYTPMTTEIVEMIERLHLEYGRWRAVSEVSGLRLKQLRAIRQHKHANGKRRKTISLRTMDRILTTTEVGHINDYPWYTPDELVEMGIWKPIGNG